MRSFCISRMEESVKQPIYAFKKDASDIKAAIIII
jgi:hypothetical protein